MDFTLTPDHESIRDTARAFCRRELLPHVRDWDRAQQFPREVLPKMAAEGLLSVCIPRRYGGLGRDYLSLGLVSEELERVDSAFRVLLAVHLGLNSLALFQWGDEAQRQKYLVPQARGEKLAAFGLTEPGAGSDVAGIRTTARRDGDAYVLNGEKTWIGFADVADHFLIFACTDPAAGGRGISAFVVERVFEGISTSSIRHKLGGRVGNTGGIVLRDVRVPVENRLGEEGEGFKIALSALDNGRYTVAAGGVGLIEACLEASLEYAKRRETFGQPIGRRQLIQQKIARMVAGRDIGRLLYYQIGWLKNRGRRCTREVSLAKWVTCQNAFQAADDAVQIHGAHGYSDEHPVERYFRNARGALIYEGTQEIHQLIQADYALGDRVDRPLSRPLPPFEEDP
ncbi:MAG: butyryl-CoA dehydrogenase [Candidatus Handelsmanbacteria bacterium RIFCSPLOWO2_12_FULL_64_10]|uniref:Butyryl-CoA dehydrogenase n=1 Tax=Handelsmanbacteria sp. (strain RIFCSPLOWO2_12_FULL_64_10) TaxID=1817868 RepID=A0A1F6CYD4_HANXR|nr:MAG: butyryl-CoA dehydrogenase [Candidatus Handelsmanbacteria bacterium RIFCSPLOWO2_12_FULL_64_10]